MNITEAFALYTGGNIWLFYGSTSDENYFLTDDDGNTLILNDNPSNGYDFFYDEWEEWQNKHLIRELSGKERENFCNALCDYLLTADAEHKGGITGDEIEAYRMWFEEN